MPSSSIRLIKGCGTLNGRPRDFSLLRMGLSGLGHLLTSGQKQAYGSFAIDFGRSWLGSLISFVHEA